jgi:hypothetical protein
MRFRPRELFVRTHGDACRRRRRGLLRVRATRLLNVDVSPRQQQRRIFARRPVRRQGTAASRLRTQRIAPAPVHAPGGIARIGRNAPDPNRLVHAVSELLDVGLCGGPERRARESERQDQYSRNNKFAHDAPTFPARRGPSTTRDSHCADRDTSNALAPEATPTITAAPVRHGAICAPCVVWALGSCTPGRRSTSRCLYE